ncbi:hypothetical protein ILUMI_20625, partial [Ignelater luminosus]
MLDQIADIMAFGALEPCEVCLEGQLSFDQLGYKCNGNLTEWAVCNTIVKEPRRRIFIVPEELKNKYKFLEEYEYVERTRLIRDIKPSLFNTLVKQEDPPLYNMEFVIIGDMEGKKSEIEKQIISFGGKVITKIKQTIMAVISTPIDVENMSAPIIEAKNANIHVVSPEFLDKTEEYSGNIPELVLKTSICTWGANPYSRLPPSPSTSSSLSDNLQLLTSLPNNSTKIKVKRGGSVHPDSDLQDLAHIYQDRRGNKYTAVLGLTEIQQQINKHYILQLLEDDKGQQYWLFRSWGRNGTNIRDKKLEKMTLREAIKQFCDLFEKKTGNLWSARQNFIKLPGKMYPIDVDYEEETKLKIIVPSKLSKPVQQLIQFIFDVNEMNQVMLELELDTDRMPLGKLSKSQLRDAYKVLAEIPKLIESEGSGNSLLDASNRFYTLVPHSSGLKNLPIINNLKLLKEKKEIVDNLWELQIAYNLVQSSDDNIVDSCYDQLKTEIDVLDCTSEEYQIIQEYVKNTHAATHTRFELELLEVFTVKRQEEEKRFKPFQKLSNRKLLWHGSHTTNFASILSQGLCIAPPEAPVTGYMFGKGIYFADMVSKSAKYCHTNIKNHVGLLLLCEVALGEMYELENAEYVENLPEGKHSVKGIGRTEPDPKHTKELPGGVHVPLGKGIVMDRSKATSLLYN